MPFRPWYRIPKISRTSRDRNGQFVASRRKPFHADSPRSSMDNTARWRYRYKTRPSPVTRFDGEGETAEGSPPWVEPAGRRDTDALAEDGAVVSRVGRCPGVRPLIPVHRCHGPASAGERAAERHDPFGGADVGRDRPRCIRTRRGIARPRSGSRAQSRIALGIHAARLLEEPLRGRQRCRPHVRVGRRGDRARGQTQSAFDAILEPLVRLDPVGRGGLWERVARPDRTDLIREPFVQLPHVYHEVGEHGDVGQRLHGDRRPEGVGGRHAGEDLAAVHLHPARATRGVEAGVPERERRIAMQLDPPEGLEDRGACVDRHLEAVEPPPRVPALVAVDAERPGRRRGAVRVTGFAHASLRSVSA